jgi:hypothetical protein
MTYPSCIYRGRAGSIGRVFLEYSVDCAQSVRKTLINCVNLDRYIMGRDRAERISRRLITPH